jgi:hypothetical protein
VDNSEPFQLTFPPPNSLRPMLSSKSRRRS